MNHKMINEKKFLIAHYDKNRCLYVLSGEFFVVYNIKNETIIYIIYLIAYFYYFYLTILYMYVSYRNYSLTQSSSSNVLLPSLIIFNLYSLLCVLFCGS